MTTPMAQLAEAFRDRKAVHCAVANVWYVDTTAGICGLTFDVDESDYVDEVPYYGPPPVVGAPALYFTFEHTGAAIGIAADATGGGGTPDVTPPSAPLNLRAASVARPNVSLVWDPSTDPDAGSGVAQYLISRRPYGGTFAQIGVSATNTYTDVTAVGNAGAGGYEYQVAAVDFAGNQSLPSAAIAVPLVPDTAPVPANLTETAASRLYGYIELTWDPAFDDSGGPLQYRIYRSPYTLGTYTQIGTSMVNSYRDYAPQYRDNYDYRVTAVDANGNESAPSNVRSVQGGRPYPFSVSLTVMQVPFSFSAGATFSPVMVIVFGGPSPFSQKPAMSFSFTPNASTMMTVGQQTLAIDNDYNVQYGVQAYRLAADAGVAYTYYADLTFTMAPGSATVAPRSQPAPDPGVASDCPCGTQPPPDDPNLGPAICLRMTCRTQYCPNQDIDNFVWAYAGAGGFCAGCHTEITDIQENVC